MNPPFHCWFEFTGDMWASGGHVVSFNAAGSAEFAVGGGTGGVNQASPLAGVISAQPLPGQVFLGGSGRNYLVSNGPSVGAEFANGYYKPIAPNVWEPPGFPGWTLTLDPGTGALSLHDGTDELATAAGAGDASGVTSGGTVPNQDYALETDYGITRLYRGVSDADFYIILDVPSGDALLHDLTSSIAERLGGDSATVAGVYLSTVYGEATYNGSSPFTYTVTGGDAPDELTASAYGEATYNGSAPFTADLAFEGDFTGQAAELTWTSGTAQGDTYAWTGWQTWEASGWTVTIDGSGAGELSDGTDVVATRAANANLLYSPAGAWLATSYGITTYGDSESVTSGTTSGGTLPEQDWVFLSTAGAIDTYVGTTDSSKYIELDTGTGDAILYDGGASVCERLAGSTSDIDGAYAATSYGELTYNASSSFTYTIATASAPQSFGGSAADLPKTTQDGYSFVKLDLDGSNEVTAASGPFRDTAMPANSASEVYVPIAKVASGSIQQIASGMIQWQP